MFERFTAAAREAVVAAQEQARGSGHHHIGTEHLLLGVLADVDGVAATVLRDQGVERAAVVSEMAALGNSDADALRAIGIDLGEVRRKAEAAFGPGALDRVRCHRVGLFRHRMVDAAMPFSAATKQALERSVREAQALKHSYIRTEHLLLGLLGLLADETSTATQMLRRLGMRLDLGQIRARVLDELGRVA